MPKKKANISGLKSKEAAKELLNWGAISSYLTDGNDRIRKNRIPRVHEERINLLIRYFAVWMEGKEMIFPSELEEAIDKIDLKTMIMGEKLI